MDDTGRELLPPAFVGAAVAVLGLAAVLAVVASPLAGDRWAAPSPPVPRETAISTARQAVDPDASLIMARVARFAAAGLWAPDVPGDRVVWVVSFDTTMPKCPPWPAPGASLPSCTSSHVQMDVVVDAETGAFITAGTR
jgi:hypothetical protein